jgi:hypothetical protein
MSRLRAGPYSLAAGFAHYQVLLWHQLVSNDLAKSRHDHDEESADVRIGRLVSSLLSNRLTKSSMDLNR